MRLRPTSFLSLSLYVSQAYSICECGYRIRSNNAYFTSVLVSNFSSMPNTYGLNDNAPDFNKDWTVQSWSASPSKDHPLNRTNSKANVWIQDGALVLRQQGYSEDDNQAGRNVSCAAIVSKRSNFGRVSARAVFEVDVGDVYPRGSVAGFFWYYDDKNEIDIEVLTKEANDTTIHYTTHPSLDGKQNPIPQSLNQSRLATTWRTLQTHRFDVSSSNVTFYENSTAIHTTTTNVPAVSVGGTLQLNLWASASDWSGFPSRENVTMRVTEVLVFYNESGNPGLSASAADACRKAGGPTAEGAVCEDQGMGYGVRKQSSAVGGVRWEWRTQGLVIGLVWAMAVFLL